ncbi:HNH endonuclease family protein [Streptomyces sp. NPDC058665]|uniref:HNH endonuclease family protein n=1 Tax=Streptomyces sp. NPDC058665 TaxID=3346586 RepID=UPI003664C438
MITKLRTALCAMLAAVALLGGAPAHAAEVTLPDAIRALSVAAETNDGYERTAFRHWIDEDRDGCSTRAEVLIEESRTEPVVEANCRIISGTWHSYYDGRVVTDPSELDIDHMGPLKEAWGSGAKFWTKERRQAYANDLTAERSLVAVTAATNRSKADKDPAQWLPPLADARCTYIADWVSTKLRWSLSVDQAEHDALLRVADGCGYQRVTYESAA